MYESEQSKSQERTAQVNKILSDVLKIKEPKVLSEKDRLSYWNLKLSSDMMKQVKKALK